MISLIILAGVILLICLYFEGKSRGTKVDKDFYVSKEARKHIKKAKGSDN